MIKQQFHLLALHFSLLGRAIYLFISLRAKAALLPLSLTRYSEIA